MSNRVISIALLLVGLFSWYAPGFNGLWSDPSTVTDGEGRIAGAVFMVGAAIVWFQRP